jgi:hypothetical protein
MKHLKTMIALFTMVIIAVACKKQTVITPPTAVTKKLQKMVWTTSYPLTQNYSYDAQGRLTKYQDEYVIITYVFGTNTVAIKEFRVSENRFVADVTGITDNAGRATSLTGSYSYNINQPYTEQTTFTYDAGGYLKQFVRTKANISLTYDYTVTNGDYTKLVYQSTNAGGYTQITDFHTDKPSISGVETIPIGPGFHNGLYGKVNTHLIKFQQLTQSGSPTPSWGYNYAYTLDGNGYVQTMDQTGTSAASVAYTFQ